MNRTILLRTKKGAKKKKITTSEKKKHLKMTNQSRYLNLKYKWQQRSPIIIRIHGK